MAPSDQNELIRMINTSIEINDRPSAFRYPRGTGIINENDFDIKPLDIGKGVIIIEETKRIQSLFFGKTRPETQWLTNTKIIISVSFQLFI